LPNECHKWDYPREFKGVNLFNSNQINHVLFKIFKLHTSFINYWLDNFLFNKELQQFDFKLSTSAWDICGKKRQPTVGFSGTNDFRLLLPLNMKYSGLKELRDTNAYLVSNLLLEKNNIYIPLDQGCTSTQILKIISRNPKCRVLLDVGALMLDFDNEKVAKKWLEVLGEDSEIEAAVFFDQNNDLMVLEKNGDLNKLEVSTFKNQLGKCVIYLDDCHTRGTDLKIPPCFGAVTLGKDLSKDKLMQACMRLRMLGTRHFVRFYASHEVDCIIKNSYFKRETKSISSKEVIEWTIENSARAIKERFFYWSNQGFSYFKRNSAFLAFKSNSDQIELFKNYAEKEQHDLHKLYSGDIQEEFILNIIERNYSNLTNSPLNLSKDFDKILKKIRKYANEIKRFAHSWEEEQEMEIELEIEREEIRQLEVQKIYKFEEPKVSEMLRNFVKSGKFTKASDFIHLPDSLNQTSLKNDVQSHAWDGNLYVTSDFIRTVNYPFEHDEMLRPPKWIVIKNDVIVVIRYLNLIFLI
jgi:hypothetical protein